MNAALGNDQEVFARAIRNFQGGRLVEGLQLLIAAASSSPSQDRLSAIVSALIGMRRAEDAAMLSRALTETYATRTEPWLSLAESRFALCRYDKALDAALRSLDLSPADSRSLEVSAVAALLAKRNDLARDLAERCLSTDPKCERAAAVLSELLVRDGRLSAASELTRQFIQKSAIRKINLVSRPSTKALLLEGIGSGWFGVSAVGTVIRPDGHSNIAAHLDLSKHSIYAVTIDAIDVSDPILAADVIVNTMAEPTSLKDPLRSAANSMRGCNSRTVNRPESVLLMDRDSVAHQLRAVAGLVVPRSLTIYGSTPSERRDAAKELLAAANFAFPVILRPSGAHTANVHLLSSLSELREDQCRSRSGAVSATEYVDCRWPDGNWRKTRAVVVGGEPIVEHHYIDGQFCVRSAGALRFMKERPWAEAEAAHVVAAPAEPRDSILREIGQRIKLDAFGVDFTTTADGRLVLFEASACVRYITPHELEWEGRHLLEPVRAIRSAINELLTGERVRSQSIRGIPGGDRA